MTIAVAVRTGSAVVFAADSKVTTSGIVGIEEDGNPRWMEQTYDNATKVVHDASKTVMALVAGEANIGQETAMDFIMARDLRQIGSASDQDNEVASLIESMVERKKEYWGEQKIEPERWPGPTLLLAVPAVGKKIPRVWRADLRGEGSEVVEILTLPSIRLEGSYNEVFGLLYGFESNVLSGIMDQLKIEKEKIGEAIRDSKVLKPLDKLSLWSMPIQDAIDLAVFLAKVQVEMDRFLPGQPACGGPIDVMVLRMVPECAILNFAGKRLHHPINESSHGE